MSARRLVLATFCTVVGALVFASASAVAMKGHLFSTAFTGSGASALSEPSGVAVSNATGGVYVVDRGHNRVEELDSTGTTVLGEFDGAGAPTGAFSSPEAIAVDNSTSLLDPSAGDVYVTDTGHGVVDKFTSTGTYLGQITTGAGGAAFGTLYGVAVDGEGSLWVYQASGEIDEYDNASTNAFLSSRNSPFGTSPGFAVDSEDNLYVNRGAEVFAKLDNSGAKLSDEVDGETSKGAAVDLSSNAVYIDNVTTIGLFSASGSLIERFGAGHLTGGSGVAVNYSIGSESSGRVYVADSAGNDVAVFDLGPLPEVSVQAAASLTTKSVTLNGTVNPMGPASTSCQFEYGPTESYGSTVPCSSSPGSGNSPVPVSANIGGLTPRTTYHYRLAAINANGTYLSADAVFATHGAAIDGESVTAVRSTSVRLGAQIDPGGTDTVYHFEYDTSAYEASAPHGVSLPVPAADIGSGIGGVLVSAQPESLQPETIYHYRVVAVSEIATGEYVTFDGPDNTFTTFGSPSSCPGNERLRTEQASGTLLPDCRAYEMVSPLDKNDNNIAGEGSARASSSGDVLTYVSKGAFAGAKGGLNLERYLGRRGGEGWSVRNLTPVYRTFSGQLVDVFNGSVFTPDLSKGVLSSNYTPLTSGSVAGYVNLYLDDFGSEAYELVSSVVPPGTKPYAEDESIEPFLAGASTDLSKIVFQQRANLTPDASPGPQHLQQLYEWTGGRLTLVDVAPEGTTFEAADSIGAPNYFGSPADSGDVWHAVSADGSRVIFTAGEVAVVGESEKAIGQVYLREMDRPRSVEISASQRKVVDPLGTKPARYWDASVDGSRVFFTSKSELTDDANTGPADNAANLYEYDVGTGVLKDLSVDANHGDANGAAVLGLVTASEDGSYVYFVAEGAFDGAAVSGQPNLYVYHAGSARFITTLAPATSRAQFELGGDSGDWYGAQPSYGDSAVGSFGPRRHTVRVTKDGTRLAFESELSLTGYDNRPVEPQECENDRCREVYLYDTAKDRLVCVSCGASEARPIGPAELGGDKALGVEGYGGLEPFYEPRNFSADGSRLFFQSPDALVAHDSNGQVDVYEYENGSLYPISDVAGNHASFLLDASASGNDVFIATADQLLPSDTDFRVDAYDVRVDGGFPVSLKPPACQNGDSCKAPVSLQPSTFGAPASATFSGAGNIFPSTGAKAAPKSRTKSKRCKKGRVRRHGACVKSKTRKSGGHSKKGRK